MAPWAHASRAAVALRRFNSWADEREPRHPKGEDSFMQSSGGQMQSRSRGTRSQNRAADVVLCLDPALVSGLSTFNFQLRELLGTVYTSQVEHVTCRHHTNGVSQFCGSRGKFRSVLRDDRPGVKVDRDGELRFQK